MNVGRGGGEGGRHPRAEDPESVHARTEVVDYLQGRENFKSPAGLLHDLEYAGELGEM